MMNLPIMMKCLFTANATNSKVTLQWTAPTEIHGQEIEYYLVDVLGFICPLDQCNVTTTNTTITGLLCNTSYTVTVRAVNCAGISAPSQTVVILPPNGW